MKKVIILKGLPASGKSTWARKIIDQYPGAYKRVNKDDLRAMLDNGKWSKTNESLVLNIRDSIILAALKDGKHVIVDDTNLVPKHESHIRELVKGKADVEIEFFEATVEECIERDLKRPVSVGESVIRGMWEQFLKPKVDPIVQDEKLHHAIICDLDGTLALMNGRNPYDASTCEQDAVNLPVWEVVRFIGSLKSLGISSSQVGIILMSGREDKYREQTERWLKKNGVIYDALYMRKTDDMRKDSVVKREMFNEYIRDKYFVKFVLDDRNQVVEMWRELGLTCFQVAEGSF